MTVRTWFRQMRAADWERDKGRVVDLHRLIDTHAGYRARQVDVWSIGGSDVPVFKWTTLPVREEWLAALKTLGLMVAEEAERRRLEEGIRAMLDFGWPPFSSREMTQK